jgi:hypothetical protein
MNVPGGSAKPLSRTQSSKPARDFSSHRPSLFMRPDDSVYRERTSFPSALMRIILETAFGLSGTPICRLANARPEPRRTTNTTIFPAKHACARSNTHWPDLVRSIGNAQPLTRSIRFRSIENASLRIPKSSFGLSGTPGPQLRRFPFRSIGNAPCNSPKTSFGLSGTPSRKSADFLFGLWDTPPCDSPKTLFGLSGTICRKPADFPFGLSGTIAP